jgi:hypothetical protein
VYHTGVGYWDRDSTIDEMPTRFGLKSLFYITFLFGSASLAARLVMDMPDFAVPVVFVVSWLTILGVVLASIVLRR